MQTEFEITTKSKLIKAGIEVFSDHGFAGGSIRQIAERAGANIAAVTYHFGSKKELWKAVFTHLQDRLLEAIFANESEWRNLTPYERVRSTTKSYIRFCAKHPELHRITLFETIHGGEMLDWLNEQKLALFSKKSIEWVSLAQEEGVYSRDVSAIHLHFIIVHASNSIFLLAPHIKEAFGIEVFDDAQIDKFTDAIISLFLNRTDLEPADPARPSPELQDFFNKRPESS